MIYKLINTFFKIYFLLLTSFVSAQYTVSGTVKDNNNNNLVGANVFIQSIGIGAIVDFDGNFELSDIPNGTYELTASLISYKNKIQDITVNNKNLTDIEILLESAPMAKTKIIVEGKQKEKSTIQPMFKLRFNGIYKSFNSPILELPPNLSVDNQDIYENVFLRKNAIPELILGVSKQFNNGLKTGFLMVMVENESRIFIQSSFIKMEIGQIGNSPVISVGSIYENSRLNIEFDIHFYDIIKNTTLNKRNLKDNITASITLSSNFD